MAIDKKRVRELLSIWCHIILDVTTLLFLLGVFLSIFFLQRRFGLVNRQGFFCDDLSIRYPYVQPHIPDWVLPLLSIAASLVVITVGNLIDHVTLVIRKRRHHSFHPCGKDSRRCSIPPWLARTGKHLKWYHTGLLITAIVTFIAKSVAGQLRPNFIDVCQPHLLFRELNCTDKLGYPRYVTEYVCTGDLFSAFSARLSWPSAHASISSFDFVFLAIFVSSVRVFHHRSAIKLFLIFIFLMSSLVVSVYSFVDHRSHPTDILSGWVLGGSIAALVALYNLKYFTSETRKVSWHDTKESELEPLTSK